MKPCSIRKANTEDISLVLIVMRVSVFYNITHQSKGCTPKHSTSRSPLHQHLQGLGCHNLLKGMVFDNMSDLMPQQARQTITIPFTKSQQLAAYKDVASRQGHGIWLRQGYTRKMKNAAAIGITIGQGSSNLSNQFQGFLVRVQGHLLQKRLCHVRPQFILRFN